MAEAALRAISSCFLLDQKQELNRQDAKAAKKK
jgi:hypothetical protein